MGYWQIVVPEATQNLILDPSFADSGMADWTVTSSDGSGTAARVTTRTTYGYSSAQITLNTASWVRVLQTHTVTAVSYTLSCRVRRSGGGAVTATECRAMFDSGVVSWATITDLSNGYYLCEYSGTATAGARQFGPHCIEDGLFVDSVQLEQKAYRTTFCDGEQPGCTWNGLRYRSASTRSAQSRDGGRVYNLDDYGAYVTKLSGIGMPPVKNLAREYGLLPGAEFDTTSIAPRIIQMVLSVSGTDRENLHTLRAALTDILKPDAVLNQQPVLLRYTAPGKIVQVRARYEAGLEYGGADGYTENIALRFLCLDPFWTLAEREISTALDVNDSATHSYVSGRVDGVWDAMGPPSAGGQVYVVKRGPDGNIYVGGNFTNWDGIANADYIAYWDGSAWNALGSGMNGIVYDIVFDPNGTLYACGAFTTAGGGGANRIASWDGSSWSALGTGLNAVATAMTVGLEGYLYVTGNFTTAGGGGAVRIAYWDGSAWNAMGAGLSGTGYALGVLQNGWIQVGGDFVRGGGQPGDYVGLWTGSAWDTTTGLNDVVRGIAVAPDGRAYFVGDFTDVEGGGGGNYNKVIAWDASSHWQQLGTGLAGGNGYSVAIGPDGLVYAGGSFTSAGGVTADCGLMIWDGYQWRGPDIKLPGGSVTVESICCGPASPITNRIYDWYVGYGDTGTASFAGSATFTYSGTRSVYPRFLVKRGGGTGMTLISIRNETTGYALHMRYNLLAGEILEIDTRPGQFSVTSGYFGNRIDIIEPGSDWAHMFLLPGSNTIAVYASLSGSPTTLASAMWPQTFWGAD